ncbi:MAG: pirin family protein [Salibacteraceae bacterium]
MDRKTFLKTLTGTAFGSGMSTSAQGQMATSDLRQVDRLVKAKQVQVAPGFFIRRALPLRGLNMVDPFLLLDHMGPKEIGPDEGAFVPPHPHRGFEPVTFIFEGSAEHKDSMGNHGKVHSGGVQWMTAGKGVIHSERIDREAEEGRGKMHGVQLWINLPKKDKMMEPAYQNIPAEKIPEVAFDGGKAKVRVVAGSVFDAKGPAKTFTPINAFHVVLKAKGQVDIPFPEDHNVCVYGLDGVVTLSGDQRVEGGELAVMANGKGLRLGHVEGATAQVLLLSGEPIKEPVVSHGPFVMNSMTEIQQAFEDYSNGKMGQLEE